LKAKDLDASRRFYEALGMNVVIEVPDKLTVLARGSFTISLMSFLDENLLNFRGEDAFSIHEAVRQAGVTAVGEPERYAKEQYDADADGACWETRDPDGNIVLIDTNENETGAEASRGRLNQALRSAEQDLADAGASAECLAAYRSQILSPFSTAT
jgi:catechol 2,3-dioxygenase-like lactoylglutathione lyase family enzyme